MTLSKTRVQELEGIAAQVRGHILRTVHAAGGGHVGGPLSATDMLVALYFEILDLDPSNPDWADRDRFILSKGHSCIALYAVMAERGFFPLAELMTFDAIDSRLQGHPDMTKLSGLDMSSGSLGQGLSPAIGMALGAKMRGKRFVTYAMLGDGETQEGQVWEAAFIASRYELDNLVAILDLNRLQQYGWQRPGGMRPPLEDPASKWQSFGWEVSEVDGHDITAFVDAIRETRSVKEKPSIVIAHTIKGKGVSFMENEFSWHARVPTADELELALAELGLSVGEEA